MATSTFDRKIEINDSESLEKLADIMAADAPKQPLSAHPFSNTEKDRSEVLLKHFLSRAERSPLRNL